MKLRLLGMDPSLRNWGLCSAVYDTASKVLLVNHVKTVCPALSPNKQIRQNSLDLESAAQLSGEACQAAHETDAVFVEVPVGSQSARAMASYGICVGVLGALRAGGTTFFEVNPTEVKMASFGAKKATKQQMIDWATAKHPEANWPTVKRNGKSAVSSAKAEHMADALATIYAGIASQPFQQLLTFMSQQNNRSPYGHSIQATSN